MFTEVLTLIDCCFTMINIIMKTLREMIDLVESAQAMNKIDQAILLGLTDGMPPEAIAKSLNIPVDWVLEIQNNYKAPKVIPRDDRLTPSDLGGMNEETKDPLKKIDELFKDK
jgi:hypothetical protein